MITKPKIQIDLAEVERLASEGKTQAQIAACLGISETTFYGRKRENADFEEAIKKGQESATDQVENVVFKEAIGGNMTAAIFWLKCRRPDRWSDRQKLDLTSSTPVQIQIINDLKE
ncbi:hypothetical protein ACR77U_12065 [Enterococcus faecium]|uniref:hypothetical protein n=1 Tax=Enterococcus faecium TaxID=1352 RepID=UPI003DA565A5